MKLIKFPEQTVVIAKNQPGYLPLPAHVVPGDDQGMIVCCWQLTIWERLKLLFSGKLWHHVLTFRGPLQPQRLQVDKPVFVDLFIESFARQQGVSVEDAKKAYFRN